MKEARLDVVAIGEAMIEFNAARAADPDTFLQGFGGDTSNMAIAAARLGARAGYVTRVGDDAFGRQLLALWRGQPHVVVHRHKLHGVRRMILGLGCRIRGTLLPTSCDR